MPALLWGLEHGISHQSRFLVFRRPPEAPSPKWPGAKIRLLGPSVPKEDNAPWRRVASWGPAIPAMRLPLKKPAGSRRYVAAKKPRRGSCLAHLGVYLGPGFLMTRSPDQTNRPLTAGTALGNIASERRRWLGCCAHPSRRAGCPCGAGTGDAGADRRRWRCRPGCPGAVGA